MRIGDALHFGLRRRALEIVSVVTIALVIVVRPALGQSCPDNILQNWDFASGIAPGWSAAYSSPDYGAGAGCSDVGFVGMWGNQIVGEGLQQAGVSLTAGNTYLVSMCVRWIPTPNQPYPPRFRVRASDAQLTSPFGGVTIGVTPYLAANEWTTIALPEWTAPANYTRITISVENQSSFNHGDSTTYAHLDNVCIVMDDGCDCPCWADPHCDGVRSDLQDVIAVVNVAFRGCPSSSDPDCSTQREDVNNSGAIDVLDVSAIVNVAFRGGNAASGGGNFVNPCGPGPFAVNGGPDVVSGVSEQSAEVSMASSVIVESKTVAPNATGVEIGVYITNDVPLIGLVLPLEIRTVSGGAYMASGGFSRGTNPAGRLENSPLGAADGGGAWPSANVTQRTYAVEVAGGANCTNSFGNGWNTAAALPDFISPDAIMHATLSTGDPGVSEQIEMPPGSDPAGVPSYRIICNVGAAQGQFIIDTTCTLPANHLTFVLNAGACDAEPPTVPTFVPGIITIGTPINCGVNTTADAFLAACPRGDSPYRVRLKDGLGNPIVGYSNITLDFSACSPTELIPSPGKHPTWPTVFPTAPSDANGIVTFNVFAGGDCADCEVTVTTDCGFSTTVPVHSLDVDGNLCVDPSDHRSVNGLCRDYNASGNVNAQDYSLHLAHLGHCAPLGACDNLSIRLRVLPEAELEVGDTITIDWSLSNVDNVGICTIDSVAFYHFNCESELTLDRVAGDDLGQLLLPGTLMSGQVRYANPDLLDFCLEARVYSNCCSTYASQIVPVTVRSFCSVGDACVAFYSTPLDIIEVQFSDDDLLADGWSYDVQVFTHHEFGLITQTLICTGPDPQVGQSGSVSIFHTGYGGLKAYTFKIESVMGDVCGRTDDCGELLNQEVPNCVIDVLDVVCMINYIFRGFPPPCPVENVDLNCDCVANVVDIVTIVNTAFRGQPPPPRCDEVEYKLNCQ